jgi:hypothetical protein
VNALAVLKEAHAAGIALALDGEDLLLEAKSAPPTEVLELLRRHKPDVVELLRTGLWAAANRKDVGNAVPLPCPSDVAERSTLIAEGDGCDPVAADARALDEHGYVSWSSLASAHRDRILAQLAKLPPPTDTHGHRLLHATRAFLESAYWELAVKLGWSLAELFGINPHAPLHYLGGEGLVTGLALSKVPGGRLVAIAEGHAIIQFRSGSTLTYRRFMPAMDTAVVWWECPALIGLEGSA